MWETCRFRKGELREGSSPPGWWTGKAREERAESKLADVPNSSTQFRCTQTHKHSCVYTDSDIWMFNLFWVKRSKMLGKQGVSFMQHALGLCCSLLFLSVPSVTVTWQHQITPPWRWPSQAEIQMDLVVPSEDHLTKLPFQGHHP